MKQANETKRRPGRPPIFPSGTMKNCHILLSQEHVAAAERLGNGNMAEGVRLALEPHVEQAEQEGAK